MDLAAAYIYYKPIKNNVTFVLKRLQIVDNLVDDNSRVDRMWERLLPNTSLLRPTIV